MKRARRFTLRRIMLGLVVAAITPATAQARPADFWNYDPQTGEKIANSSPGVAPGELAKLRSVPSDASTIPDDRPFSRATIVARPPSVADSGSSDLRVGVVGGFTAALVLAACGGLLAIRHSRKTKLLTA